MFELASPWVLFFLPLPLLIWFLMPKTRIQLPAALRLPFYTDIQALVDKDRKTIIHQKKLLIPIIVWILLVLAATNPRWIGEPQPINREGYNIMMVLDLSSSMELTDMVLHGRPASRLTLVKRAAEQFVKARDGDKIGLILFGSRAYLQTPLTYDRHSVLLRIEDATPGLAGRTTSIGDALGLAVKRLQEVPKEGRVVILLTDGANTSGILNPLKAAELAKMDGIKVYTIGLGANADPRAMANTFMLPALTAELDEKTLEKIASMTGGHYFRATDMQSLQAIYARINELETISQEQATLRPQKDYYPWPLGLGLFLLFYWLGIGLQLPELAMKTMRRQYQP